MLDVPHKILLQEVAKKLPVIGLKFNTYYRYLGFFSTVDADVPDVNIPVKLHHVFTSSGLKYSTANAAEEKAAESLIRSLERDFKFETKDLNWWNMRRFNRDSYNSCTGWRAAKEENHELKMRVDALTNGWRRTLERVDRVCDKAECARSTTFESCEPGVSESSSEEVSDLAFMTLTSGIAEFEQLGGKY
jgi:hypothetical protein